MQNGSCSMNNTSTSGNRSCGASMQQALTSTQAYITTSTVLLSILIPAILIGNVLVILAFGTTRRLRSTTNYFVVSLAVADIMIGGLSLPIFTVGINKGLIWQGQNTDVIHLWQAIDMITSIASIVNCMYISVDRYVCVQYPLRYHQLVTNSKVIVMIALSWLYGLLIWALVRLTYRRKKPRPAIVLLMTILAFILPLLVIIIMYGKIGKIAFNHRMRIIAIEEQHVQSADQSPSHKNKRTLSLLTELKATKTLAVVVGAFVLCYIGYFILVLYIAICNEWTGLQCKIVPELAPVAVQWIKYFNSSLNPLIYTVMNGDMRRAMHRLVRGRLTPAESSFEMQ